MIACHQCALEPPAPLPNPIITGNSLEHRLVARNMALSRLVSSMGGKAILTAGGRPYELNNPSTSLRSFAWKIHQISRQNAPLCMLYLGAGYLVDN